MVFHNYILIPFYIECSTNMLLVIIFTIYSKENDKKVVFLEHLQNIHMPYYHGKDLPSWALI